MQDAQLEAEVVPPDCGGAIRLNAVQRPQVADVLERRGAFLWARRWPSIRHARDGSAESWGVRLQTDHTTHLSPGLFLRHLQFALLVLGEFDRSLHPGELVSIRSKGAKIELAVVVLQFVHQVAATSRLVVVRTPEKIR